MLDRRGRSLIGIVIGVIVLAAAVSVVLGRRSDGGESARARTEAAAPAAEPEGNPAGLDPAPYRAQIERLEAVLYQPGQPDFGTGDRVQSLAMELGSAVMHGAPRASRAGQRVMAFASRVGAETDVGYAAFDVVAARERWEALRTEVFRPAPWFRDGRTRR